MTVAGVSMGFFPSTCRWRTVCRVSVGFCKRQVLLLRTRCPFGFHFSKVDATRGRYGRERVCGVCGIFPSFWAYTNRGRGRGGIHAHMCRWSQPKILTARRSSSTSTVLRGELRGNHGCWSAGACVGFQRGGERRTLLARVRTWSSGSKLSRRRQWPCGLEIRSPMEKSQGPWDRSASPSLLEPWREATQRAGAARVTTAAGVRGVRGGPVKGRPRAEDIARRLRRACAWAAIRRARRARPYQSARVTCAAETGERTARSTCRSSCHRRCQRWSLAEAPATDPCRTRSPCGPTR